MAKSRAVVVVRASGQPVELPKTVLCIPQFFGFVRHRLGKGIFATV